MTGQVQIREKPLLSLIAMLAVFLILPRGFADAGKPVPPGKLIDIGGYRLHINCTGTGQPTVILESGAGDFSFDWNLVQGEVAKQTSVCSYDRAGYAWSDQGPTPRT